MTVKITNPTSGRKVNLTGKIGLEIIQDYADGKTQLANDKDKSHVHKYMTKKNIQMPSSSPSRSHQSSLIVASTSQSHQQIIHEIQEIECPITQNILTIGHTNVYEYKYSNRNDSQIHTEYIDVCAFNEWLQMQVKRNVEPVDLVRRPIHPQVVDEVKKLCDQYRFLKCAYSYVDGILDTLRDYRAQVKKNISKLAKSKESEEKMKYIKSKILDIYNSDVLQSFMQCCEEKYQMRRCNDLLADIHDHLESLLATKDKNVWNYKENFGKDLKALKTSHQISQYFINEFKKMYFDAIAI